MNLGLRGVVAYDFASKSITAAVHGDTNQGTYGVRARLAS